MRDNPFEVRTNPGEIEEIEFRPGEEVIFEPSGDDRTQIYHCVRFDDVEEDRIFLWGRGPRAVTQEHLSDITSARHSVVKTECIHRAACLVEKLTMGRDRAGWADPYVSREMEFLSRFKKAKGQQPSELTKSEIVSALKRLTDLSLKKRAAIGEQWSEGE